MGLDCDDYSLLYTNKQIDFHRTLYIYNIDKIRENLNEDESDYLSSYWLMV